MKNKKLNVLALSCLVTLGGLGIYSLTSCNPTDEPVVSTATASISGGNVEVEEGKTVTLTASLSDGSETTWTWASNDPMVATVDANGVVTGVSDGTVVITATAANGSSASAYLEVTNVVDMGKAVSGLVNLSTSSPEVKNQLLGIQEKYAYDEFLTGIPMVADTGYQMFSERTVLPVETYTDIMGFGGTSYYDVDGVLPGYDSNYEYASYFHSGMSEDPAEIYAMDADGESVSNLAAMTVLPLWSYKFNENKNGGVLYPVTAEDALPEVLDADENGQGHKFKVRVKTGEDGLKYSYAGSRNSNWDGRQVELEDYLTNIKLGLTQSYGLYRGAEMAGDGYTQLLKGAKDYFNATKEGGYNDDLFSRVGISVDESDNSIIFETVSAFDAAGFRDAFQGLPYYSPLPMEVVEEIGVTNYGKWSTDRSLSPVDNTLSIGPWTLSHWETDKGIAFSKDEDYISIPGEEDMYKLDGIFYAIYVGAKTDTELLFKEFLAGKLDAVSIPVTQLDQYVSDPRTKSIPDTGTWKLNVNATTPELWEELFGVNGSVAQTPASDYWDVKPIMSNKNFLNGLFFSMDRTAIGEASGMTPTLNYFSSAYKAYTKNADGTMVTWNDTQEHQDNIADMYPETFGYNREAALIYYKRAMQEELAKGTYAKGDPNNPTTITLTCIWQSESNIKEFGEPASTSMCEVANEAWKEYGYQLAIEHVVPGTSYTDTYDDLKTGQFDLGFGAISGYELDPLGLTQIWCSDGRSGFTLNWGPDTSVVTDEIEWDGKYYSFDSFYTACYQGGLYSNGIEVAPSTLSYETVKDAEKVQYTFHITATEGAGIEMLKLRRIEIFNPSTYVDYFDSYDPDSENGLPAGDNPLDLVFTANILSSYTDGSGAVGIYLEYDVVTAQGTLKAQYYQFAVADYASHVDE